MSSILKALKKAENRPPTKIENKFWKYSWNTPKTQNIPERKSNIVLWIICLLLGVNILVAGGKYLWPVKSEAPPPGAKNEGIGMPLQEKAAPPYKNTLPNLSAITQEAGADYKPEKQLVNTQEPRQGQARPPKKIASKKKFDFSGYRLEGLVFTDSSKDTFAVINGEIVRKGDSVGEVRVTKIQSEYVEIQSKDGAFVTRLNLY